MQPAITDIATFLSQKGYHAIPFQQNPAGLLLITVSVNGVEGPFILDTGAGVSVVDIRHAERLHLTLQIDETSFTGAGAGGQGLEVIPSKGNTIQIGDHIVHDFTFGAMSFEHVNQAMSDAGCEEFLGAIGVDVLKPGKAIIDYSTMTLYLTSVTT